MQVYLFVFNRPPESLDKHIVSPRALTIHADLDAVVFYLVGKRRCRKLTPLIGINDLGLAILCDGILDCCKAEVGVYGDG